MAGNISTKSPAIVEFSWLFVFFFSWLVVKITNMLIPLEIMWRISVLCVLCYRLLDTASHSNTTEYCMNEPVAAVSGTHLNEPTWRSWKAVLTSWQLCALAQWTLHTNTLESRIHNQHTRGAVLRSIAPSQSTESPLSQCVRKGEKSPKEVKILSGRD